VHRNAPYHSVSANDRPDYPSRLFGSKGKARNSLDKLKEKVLIQKDILIKEYGHFTAYWSLEEVRAEAPEGKQVPGRKTNKEMDGVFSAGPGQPRKEIIAREKRMTRRARGRCMRGLVRQIFAVLLYTYDKECYLKETICSFDVR